MKTINTCVAAIAMLLPLMASAQGHPENFTIQRVRTMYQGATQKGLFWQGLVENQNFAGKLTREQTELWNKQNEEIKDAVADLRKFASQLNVLLQDGVCSEAEEVVARESLAALQAATPSPVVATDDSKATGDKFQQALAERHRRIATELYMWILSGCPDD